MTKHSNTPSVKPFAFIVSFGVVSMLMDVVYQAALSVQGPLLLSLGASAAIVGLVSGLGEATALVGRLFSGPLADKTGRYWLFAILGYAATGLAVPAMGFIGSLIGVSALIVFERFGKSLRTPSRDAMLSHAASAVGVGKGFALHEVLDQIGAFGGPLIVAALLAASGNDYRIALGVMIIPGLLAIMVLLTLRTRVKNPAAYELQSSEHEPSPTNSKADDVPDDKNASSQHHGLPRTFWVYASACGVMLAGVATFGVVSYHMVSMSIVPVAVVPVLYAAAQLIDALFAWITGNLFDKHGSRVLHVLPFICMAIPPLAFAPSLPLIIIGVVLWGASLGIQESTMRAAVAKMVSGNRRASAYGFFSVFTGVGALIGGAVAGALYDFSIPVLCVYAVVIELAGFALLRYGIRQNTGKIS